MKLLKYILVLAVIILSFSSCKSDDDEPASIIGTWKFTETRVNGQIDTDTNVCDLMDTIQFNATQITSESFYTFDNNCISDGFDTIAYQLNGNIITVTDEGETFSTEITTLTNTTLKLKETETNGNSTVVYETTYARQ